MAKMSLDPRNARVHDKKNENAIAQSLRKNGAGRSIVIDSENVIIGGNGVFDEAQKLGLPVRIIESDGSELIAIRRTDLKTSDAKRKALAIADNRCSDLSYFDDVRLNELLKEDYDMTLQQLRRHRIALRLNKYFYRVKQSEQVGGCATYRNLDKEREQLETLRCKWGARIVRFDFSDRSHKGVKSRNAVFIDYNPVIKSPIRGV